MAADGKVEIEVILDDGTVAKGIADINGEIDKIPQSTKGAEVGVGSLIKAFAGLEVVKKVISGVTEAFKTGFNYNAQVETLTTAWGTLLGSGEKATEMVKNLNKYAAETPFDTEGVDMMAKYLYNADIKGQDMFDTMTRLGDAGSAFGVSQEGIVEMTRQYSQVMQAGVAMTEDLNIVQDKGIPIYKEIAKQQGVSVAEVRKMASESKITSDIYGAAMDSLGESAKGAMEDQSKTWSGMVSTLEDTWAQTMGIISQPIFDVAKEALSGLLKTMESEAFQNGIKQFGEQFAQVLSQVIPVVISAFGTIIKVLQQFMNILPALLPFIKAFVAGFLAFSAISKVVSVVTSVISVINKIKTAVTVAGGALKMLWGVMMANPITLIVAAVAALVAGFIYLWNTNEDFKNAMIAVWNAILAFITPIVNEIDTFIRTVFDGLKSWWVAFWPTIKETAAIVWNAILAVIRTVMGILGPYLKIAWDGIKAYIMAAWDFIKQAVSAAIKIVQGVIETVMAIIRGDWSGAWDGIKKIVSGAWDLIKAAVEFGIKAVLNVIITIFRMISQTVDDVWNGIKKAISNAIDGAKENVSNAIEGIKGFFKSLGDIDLYQVGKDVIQGFINGIGDMGKWVKDTIDGMVGNVTGWLKSAFKIGSPSRLMRDEIGKWIPPGIAVGVKKTEDVAIKSVASVQKGMVKAAQPELVIGKTSVAETAQAAQIIKQSYAPQPTTGTDVPQVIDVYTTVELDGERVSKKIAKPVRTAINKIDERNDILKRGRKS